MKRANLLISAFGLILALAACIPGNVDNSDDPPPDAMVRDPVYLSGMQLFVMESYPVQISLHVSGELPTPCHTFSYTIAEPNEKMEIHIDAFSLVEDEAICVQVIQPFEENVTIQMTGQADGLYSVWVNGEKVGEFSYPG